MNRHLHLEGCFNARDLGGLRTVDGRMTRFGAMVRSDALDHLTAEAWTTLHTYGIRTIIDLRNDDEMAIDAFPRPRDIDTIHIALDGGEDPEFWAYWGGGPRFCTPIYYRPHLDRFPKLSAQVVAAIARAKPGGVLFHCGSGRDRTGLIAMLLLALVGVPAEDIAADYELSEGNLAPLYERRGNVHERQVIAEFLEQEGTTAHALILRTLASLDVAAQLRKGGLGNDELAAIGGRLLGRKRASSES